MATMIAASRMITYNVFTWQCHPWAATFVALLGPSTQGWILLRGLFRITLSTKKAGPLDLKIHDFQSPNISSKNEVSFGWISIQQSNQLRMGLNSVGIQFTGVGLCERERGVDYSCISFLFSHRNWLIVIYLYMYSPLTIYTTLHSKERFLSSNIFLSFLHYYFLQEEGCFCMNLCRSVCVGIGVIGFQLTVELCSNYLFINS